MLNEIVFFLQSFEDLLWIYFCVPILLILGIVLSVKARFAQVRFFPAALANFWQLLTHKDDLEHRVHPMQAFFACIGGCIGIGNIVAVCTAVQIGGPGALFWLWIAAALGAILKYAEVYLGMRYRVQDQDRRYRGGPMYYLKEVFSGSWAPITVSILLCLYGVEVYQFSVVATSVSENFGWSKELVVIGLLILVLYAGLGGIQRVGKISSALVPLFILIYLLMGVWVIGQHLDALPSALAAAFYSAFSGHAATGAFVGSTLLMAMTHGMRRACYSGDLGIGYASVIHSESGEKNPSKQASLVVVDIFIDSFIVCTMTILLVLVTGVWQMPLPEELVVQQALATTFPYIEFFMPVFIFLLGYSTINAYFVVGINCAEFLAGAKGKFAYFIYAGVVLIVFAYLDNSTARTAMAIIGGLLLLLNSYGIFILRHEVNYNFSEDLDEKLTDASPFGRRQGDSLLLDDRC